MFQHKDVGFLDRSLFIWSDIFYLEMELLWNFHIAPFPVWLCTGKGGSLLHNEFSGIFQFRPMVRLKIEPTALGQPNESEAHLYLYQFKFWLKTSGVQEARAWALQLDSMALASTSSSSSNCLACTPALRKPSVLPSRMRQYWSRDFVGLKSGDV